jgi:hypothetical protein
VKEGKGRKVMGDKEMKVMEGKGLKEGEERMEDKGRKEGRKAMEGNGMKVKEEM